MLSWPTSANNETLIVKDQWALINQRGPIFQCSQSDGNIYSKEDDKRVRFIRLIYSSSLIKVIMDDAWSGRSYTLAIYLKEALLLHLRHSQ